MPSVELKIKPMGKVKVILVVIGLLLSGFLGGWLTHRYQVRQHLHQVKQMHNQGAFGAYMLDRMEATDEQREQLRPILDNYGTRLKEMNKTARESRRTVMDSLVQDITPLLRPDQMADLEKLRRYVARGPRMKKKNSATRKDE